MVEQLRRNKPAFLQDVGYFQKFFLCLHEQSTRSVSERVDHVTVEWLLLL